MKQKAIALFAAVTLVTGLAAASSANLNLFPEESSSRIDSFTSYELTVENTGTVKDIYEFSSNSPGEITFAPDTVELEPGQEEVVNVFYDPQIDRDAGSYIYTLTARSRATGAEYRETLRASVIREHEVTVGAFDNARTVCLGEEADFTIPVRNDGLMDETFRVSADTNLETQYNPSQDVEVGDGNTEFVTVSLSSQTPVQEQVEVSVASKTSYARDESTIDLNVETCYSSEISLESESRRVPAGTTATFNVDIENTGTREDTFELSASTGELAVEQVSVEPGETRTVPLTFSPESLGTTTISLTAEGESSAQTSFQVESFNGMDSSVSFESAASVCENEQGEAEVSVRNTGAATETFSLSSSRGQLEEEQVVLEPGETEEVYIQIEGSELDVGTYDLAVDATAQTFSSPTVRGTSTLSVENCNDLDMDVVPEVASAGENLSTVYRIDLENNGTRENTYVLFQNGPSWIDIRPREVTLEAGESGTAYMYAGVPFQKKGEVRIRVTAEGTQVRRQEEVRLILDQGIREAIQDDSGNRITGRFTDLLPRVPLTGPLGESAKIIGSVVAGIGVTVYLLLMGS